MEHANVVARNEQGAADRKRARARERLRRCLDEAERALLHEQLTARSERQLERESGISRYTIVRAYAGLELQPGSAFLIRAWLARIATPPQAAAG